LFPNRTFDPNVFNLKSGNFGIAPRVRLPPPIESFFWEDPSSRRCGIKESTLEFEMPVLSDHLYTP